MGARKTVTTSRDPAFSNHVRLVLHGDFDETIRSGEDYDLWLRLALVSDVALLDEPLVQVRRHEANYSRNWEIAFTGRDHSLEKLQGTVDTDRRMLLRT